MVLSGKVKGLTFGFFGHLSVINCICMHMYISNLPLSDDCVSVLSKGLTFSPSYTGKEFDTKVDLFRFYRIYIWRPGTIRMYRVQLSTLLQWLALIFDLSPLFCLVSQTPLWPRSLKRCLRRWKRFIANKKKQDTIISQKKNLKH